MSSIFNKGKLTKQQLISKLVFLVISLLAFGFLWGVEFPGDSTNEGTLKFSAMHIVFNTVCVISAFLYLVILLRKTMDQNLEWDFEPSDETDTNYFAGVRTLSLILLLVVLGSNAYKDSKAIYNQAIIFQNAAVQVNQEKETYYDNMWKSYKFKDNILKDNKATFIEVTKIIMEARSGYKDSKLTWKWVNENQNVPFEEFSRFYADLSSFVESQRAGYLKLEIKAQEIAKANNTLLDQVPNNIYNKFLNIPHITYKPGFTSAQTQKVFQSGIEEVQ